MVSNRCTVETLNATVDREIDALPEDMRAKFTAIFERIETQGLIGLSDSLSRKLTGPLWEIRVRGRGGISRALYVTARERRVVVVRVFIKKTQKTPRRDIELALRRAREVLE